jgi:hypothetical protein
MDARRSHLGCPAQARDESPSSQSIDWYAEGEAREVVIAGVCVVVRFVGRKGRRARIAITGPEGAAFRALALSKAARPPDHYR